MIFNIGERHAPAWLVLKGAIDIMRRDGLNAEAEITRMGAGQFTGEISQLAGRGTLARGRAGAEGCTALPFDAAHIRALMIGSAEARRDHDARLHPAPRRADCRRAAPAPC